MRTLTKEDKRNIKEYILYQNSDAMDISLEEIECIIGHELSPSYHEKDIWCYESKPIYKIIRSAGYVVVDRHYGESCVSIKRSEMVDLEITETNHQKSKSKKSNKTNYYKIIYPRDLMLTDYLRNLQQAGVILDNHNLVELTKDNSQKIEKEVSKKYKPNARICFESKCVNGEFPINDEEALLEVCLKINSDNSTRVSKVDVNLFVSYIMDSQNNFLEELEQGNVELVDKIETYVKDNSSRNRRYKSFASKLCKYLNEFLFKDHHDYFINDYFVRTMLPYYLDKYGITHNIHNIKDVDNMTYVELFGYLNELNKKCPELNRSELDHIMWFCYRAN